MGPKSVAMLTSVSGEDLGLERSGEAFIFSAGLRTASLSTTRLSTSGLLCWPYKSADAAKRLAKTISRMTHLP